MRRIERDPPLIMPRSAWTTRAPRAVVKMRTPSPRLWLHHLVSAGTKPAAELASAQRYHMDTKRWKDIAYSFGVDNIDGTAWTLRGPGVIGGHTEGDNSGSHAIVAIGNFEDDEPSDDLIEGIARLVAWGHVQGWWPAALTGGHTDAPHPDQPPPATATTLCPGKHLHALIPTINARATWWLGDTDPSEEDPLMAITEERFAALETAVDKLAEKLDEIHRETVQSIPVDDAKGVKASGRWLLGKIRNDVADLRALLPERKG